MSAIAPTYVQMPQDDMAQIDQIVKEYEGDPGKGLAHGVQKDAIQNSWGARLKSNEAAACTDWGFTMELATIRGKEALVFWDEGTWGLTGSVLNVEEITDRMQSRELDDPNERLSRFLARFVSGGNIGPGIFGRGKLIFHGASTTSSILVDSLRATDDLYLAFDRRVEGSTLVQPRVPLTGSEAEDFLRDATSNALAPLENPGTRIVILDLKPEVADALRYSFASSESSYAASIACMIEETWWEIIHRFGAKICIKHGDKTMQVHLRDPIAAIVGAQDGEDGVRVYEKRNVEIAVGRDVHRIKHLRLVVLPSPPAQDYNEVWVQRKRMKIGPVSRYLDVNPKIARKLCGYVVLEPQLEKIVEDAENPTHYSFDRRKAGIRRIRQTVSSHLKQFERALGLVATTEDADARRRLLDSMKELNDLAEALGLVTQQNVGVRKSDAEILVQDFNAPVPGSLRVELGDEIGPITYRVISYKATPIIGAFRVETKQRKQEPIEVFHQDLTLGPEDQSDLDVAPFIVDEERYASGEPLNIAATYFEKGSGRGLAVCGRRLFIGMEPPPPPRLPVTLSVACKFPRRDTRRVEVAEVLRGITVRITNTTPYNMTLDLKTTVRNLENRDKGRPTIPLCELLQERALELNAHADKTFHIGDLYVTPETFSSVLETVPSISERTCDLFAVVSLAKASAELNKPRRFRLNKVSIKFYLEVDPPGHAIFQKVLQVEQPANGKQSWYEGDFTSGYDFVLNVGHGAYRFLQSRGDAEIVKFYTQEQMLRQAYKIAFENSVFKGPAEEHKESLTSGTLSARETADIFDGIVGAALNEIRL